MTRSRPDFAVFHRNHLDRVSVRRAHPRNRGNRETTARALCVTGDIAFASVSRRILQVRWTRHERAWNVIGRPSCYSVDGCRTVSAIARAATGRGPRGTPVPCAQTRSLNHTEWVPMTFSSEWNTSATSRPPCSICDASIAIESDRGPRQKSSIQRSPSRKASGRRKEIADFHPESSPGRLYAAGTSRTAGVRTTVRRSICRQLPAPWRSAHRAKPIQSSYLASSAHSMAPTFPGSTGTHAQSGSSIPLGPVGEVGWACSREPSGGRYGPIWPRADPESLQCDSSAATAEIARYPQVRTYRLVPRQQETPGTQQKTFSKS